MNKSIKQRFIEQRDSLLDYKITLILLVSIAWESIPLFFESIHYGRFDRGLNLSHDWHVEF